jgi:hypothetical protein
VTQNNNPRETTGEEFTTALKDGAPFLTKMVGNSTALDFLAQALGTGLLITREEEIPFPDSENDEMALPEVVREDFPFPGRSEANADLPHVASTGCGSAVSQLDLARELILLVRENALNEVAEIISRTVTDEDLKAELTSRIRELNRAQSHPRVV